MVTITGNEAKQVTTVNNEEEEEEKEKNLVIIIVDNIPNPSLLAFSRIPTFRHFK